MLVAPIVVETVQMQRDPTTTDYVTHTHTHTHCERFVTSIIEVSVESRAGLPAGQKHFGRSSKGDWLRVFIVIQL